MCNKAKRKSQMLCPLAEMAKNLSELTKTFGVTREIKANFQFSTWGWGRGGGVGGDSEYPLTTCTLMLSFGTTKR